MKISIVTISFNQAQYLKACIDSVLDQGYPDLEYIVVDPGSTDGSREIIESYGNRIIRHFAADDGPGDGLNQGFRLATGEVFGFVNSDDELLPGALAQVSKKFCAGRTDIVAGGGYITNESGCRQRRVASSRFTPWLYVHGAVTVFQQGTFFRKEIFHRVGGFNPANKSCWDGELLLDMAMAGARFRIIPGRIANFRIYATSITGSGRFNNAYRLDNERMFEKVMGRKPRTADQVVGKLARLLKPLIDPLYLARRGIFNQIISVDPK